MWLLKYQVWAVVILFKRVSSDPVVNASFNASIRDYSTDDNNNSTGIKTLQKADIGRHANFAPMHNPIKFKEIPDSDRSSSNHGRGLLYHEQPGYVLNEYEEYPYYHNAGFEHPPHDPGHHDVYVPNSYDHHDSNYPHFPANYPFSHGYPKHYNPHALAAKTILWPIAGIALLGAAAALVSNPVLLQLGVISGKRRRRDTEEVLEPDLPDSFHEYTQKIKHIKHSQDERSDFTNEKNIGSFKTRMFKENIKKDETQTITKKRRPMPFTTKLRKNVKRNIENSDDERLIPVPLQLRTPDAPA